MKSMTGYGYGQYKGDDYSIEVEVKSYNNRFLEISHMLNPLLSSYECYIDSKIKEVASRGHLDVSIRLKVVKNNASLVLDETLLSEYINIYSKIAEKTGTIPSFADYSRLDNIICNNKNTDQEVFRVGLESAFSDAMELLLASKLSDGDGTKKDLVRLGNNFVSSLSFIEERSDMLESHFKDVLFAKYEELTGEKGKDDPRFLAEVAALLVKYSINEEISRLKSHLKEYFRLLDSNEPVGKQLDFLCQEMNRECNTIASKSQLAEINLQVVKMKDNLENIREQIRNIE